MKRPFVLELVSGFFGGVKITSFFVSFMREMESPKTETHAVIKCFDLTKHELKGDKRNLSTDLCDIDTKSIDL